MPDPVRVQQVKAGRNAGRPDEFPGVRYEQQPGPFGDAEGRRELPGGPAPLVVGEPEPDNALAREIVSGVQAAYGVTLTPEPILIGASL